MPYLILGLGVLVGAAMLWAWAAHADPRALARALKALGTVLALGLGAAVLLTSNPFLLLGVLPALLPLFLNTRALANRARAARGPTPGQTTTIETAYLRARLVHETGEVQGTILRGRHAGAALETLSLQQVLEVMVDCHLEDPRTAAVLEAYLDRTHGPDWRTEADHRRDGGSGTWQTGGGQRASGPSGAMTREEAQEILGVGPRATVDEIKAAHRRLMKQMHPDQGGSAYLAAKLNEAKTVLLGR